MAQFRNFSFGIDSLSFEDAQKNVYGIKDATTASLNGTFEIAEKRGGTLNEIRATAIHTRNSEITIESGYVDAKFAQILTGGTITSLGTSAASIVTSIRSLYGNSNTIPTAISGTTTIISPTLVKSEKYYIEALSLTAIGVVRVSDGFNIGSYTLTANGTINLTGEGIILLAGSSGIDSLTIGEKAYFESRSAINSINQKLVFDNTLPSELTMNMTVDFNGVRERITVHRVQPSGTIQQMSSTEFRIQNLTMKSLYSQELNRLAEIHHTA